MVPDKHYSRVPRVHWGLHSLDHQPPRGQPKQCSFSGCCSIGGALRTRYFTYPDWYGITDSFAAEFQGSIGIVIPEIIELLKDNDSHVRAAGVAALLKIVEQGMQHVWIYIVSLTHCSRVSRVHWDRHSSDCCPAQGQRQQCS